MSNPVVTCHVANCTFWGKGNECHAQSIVVEVDAQTIRDEQMEMSAEFMDQVVSNHGQTCCHTFKPRNQVEKM